MEGKKINGALLIATIFSCAIAFINKYPLVYSDTGAYIATGFGGIAPNDRSLFYGLFIRHISLSSSLWYVIFAQSLITCWMIRLTLGIFFEAFKRDLVFLLSIGVLTVSTAYSYTVSILVPDVFTSLTILCIMNILFNTHLNRMQWVLLGMVFIFSISTQFSSVAVVAFLFGLYAIHWLSLKLRKKEGPINFKRVCVAFYLFAFTLLLIPFTNYVFTNNYKFAGGTHVFLMNHMVESGILQEYLDEKCQEKAYRICDYKNDLSWNFMWAEDSPVQKTGGWEANREEYRAILADIMTTPKYAVMVVQKSVEYCLVQAFCFNASVPDPLLSNTAPFGQIKWRYANSLREYISSLQSAGKLKADIINVFQYLVVGMSVMFMFLVFTIKAWHTTLPSSLKLSAIVLVVHAMANAFICSNLSTIDSRFQSRIIWLLPLWALIILFKLLETKRNRIISLKKL